MTTWNNQTKNTTTYSNQAKSPIATDAFVFKIDGTYDFLIDSTYKLEIQASSAGWTNQAKN